MDLTLRFKMPENCLNVNGILLGLGKAMVKIFFALLKAFCCAVEELIIEQMQEKEPGRYTRNGHQSKARQLRTKLGLFHYRFAQLYDKVKKKPVVPLRASGFFPLYSHYSTDSTEAGIGLAVHLSYRWSTKEEKRILQNETPVPPTTLHRHLQRFAEEQCSWPDMKQIPYRFLMVDGMSIRRQEGRGKHLGKGETRWALASVGEDEPFELVGFWVEKSWGQIREYLEKRLDYGKLEVLFSDGGSGIEEALLAEGMRPQRCLLHGKRDFPYILYADGFKKAEQTPLKEKLEAIPAFQLTKKKLEQLCPEDLPKVKLLADKTEQGFQELIDILDPRKYPKARAYIENLSTHVTTFFDWWLEKGEWVPLNTNAIESRFSQVKNRIWSVGKRWSDKGLLNWLKVAKDKIFFPERWDELWTQYKSINPEIELTNISLKWSWC